MNTHIHVSDPTWPDLTLIGNQFLIVIYSCFLILGKGALIVTINFLLTHCDSYKKGIIQLLKMLQNTWYHYQSNPSWPDLTKICCFQALTQVA